MSVFLLLQDHRGARKEAEFLASNSLLQEVDGSYRLHDLSLDFIATKCQGEDALVGEAVERQSQHLGQLAVLRGYSDNGELREGFYALIGLWRKLVELSGNEQLEVDAYNKSLGELDGAESETAADVFWAVARLFGLQVRSRSYSICSSQGGVYLKADFQALSETLFEKPNSRIQLGEKLLYEVVVFRNAQR